MTTLTINKECVKHVPNKSAITTIAHNFDESEQFTFCESCENNIERSSFYDEDRGIYFTKWEVSK